MEFRVLGPVEALAAGRRVDLGHPKQRAMLAVLILELNHVVPAERLIDRTWGEAPPASARNLLYGYIAGLRAALPPDSDAPASLLRRAGGYVLEARADQVDLFRFRRLAAEAADSDADQHAARLLRDALDLWHGDAFTGLTGPWFAAMRETLNGLKLRARLDLNDIMLRQGLHDSLIAELPEQAVAYPADETADRPADAGAIPVGSAGRGAAMVRADQAVALR